MSAIIHLDIKDCPFCAGKSSLIVSETYMDAEKIAYIECEDCLCRTEEVRLTDESISEIAEKWNRRIGA